MHPENRSIGELAYRLWQARGCPEGSAEQDWLDAEQQLKATTPTLTSEVSRVVKPDAEQTSEPGTQQTSLKTANRPRVTRPKSANFKPNGDATV
jgi:hypothetical protein